MLREIDVRRLIHHPYIIRLLDIFENAKYFYIVTENIEGMGLLDYMNFKSFDVPEIRIKEVVYQVGLAIHCLQLFFIIHRDIRHDNFFMNSLRDDSSPKLVDFCLARAIGPYERCYEPFGHISYCAPEVLDK